MFPTRCAGWNNYDFMRETTAEAVAACLEAGAGIDARNDDGETPLHLAASAGKPRVVSLLLEAGAEVDARDNRGGTPLLEALRVTFGNELAIAALLDAGADVNAGDEDGRVPIHEAAMWQDAAVVGRLLELGADPNVEGSLGRPLHLVVRGYPMTPDLVLALAGAGADVNATNRNGDTPLHTAAWHGRSDDSETTALLEAGADVDARNGKGETPLHRAVAGKSPVQVDALLRGGADAKLRTPEGDTPLHLVIPREMPPHPEDIGDGMSRWVSERSRRKNVHVPDEETSRRDTAMIAALVRAGADIEARGALDLTPLELAMRNGRPRLAAKLRELGARRPTREGGRGGVLPLVCDWANAGLFGIAPVATLEGCLGLGAEAAARDGDGNTPLHTLMQGLQWNHSFVPAAMATLLAAGADPDARNGAGATPLHVASGRWGRPAIVELLVDGGADVHARDENGRTPLQMAVREENSAVIARLLELGADSTLAEDSSRIAWAAVCESWPWPGFFRHAKVDVVAGCIENGAEVTAKSPSGYWGWDTDSGRSKYYPGDHTPLHVAAAWARDPAAVTMLIGAGGDVGARDRDGHTPLHYAALDNGNPAVIAALLDAGAKVHAVGAQGRMPLHQAASENANPEVVGELLRRGADVTARLAGGRTVVHEAAQGNPNPAVLKALLEAGAEVSARGGNEFEMDPGIHYTHHSISLTPWGGTDGISEFAGSRTPLHEAAVSNGNPAIVATLIAAGADVHARAALDREYEPEATPLYWAASANPDPRVLELLVRAGADVNAPAGSGRTPLHIAALRNPVAFPTLLQLGADAEAVDREGRTPVDYAVENLWLQGWEVVRRWQEERVN
ncbi:MAG: ankyrin repeat domain-containing protein [Gemmatimonadota bacterium]|nr:ankyrin repeat domain-containing protein [Gemmatimonadota bacterium]